MRKFITLYLALACAYSALFWVVGDFTPYVSGTPGFACVYVPTASEKAVEAVKVGVVLAAISSLLFVASGKLTSRRSLLRLFLVATLALTAGLYFHGDLFKTWLGYSRWGEMREVKCEDPYGP